MNRRAFTAEAPATSEPSRESLVVNRAEAANDVDETLLREESRGWERAIRAANDGDDAAQVEFNRGTPCDDDARALILAEREAASLRGGSVPGLGAEDIQSALARIVSESEGTYVDADAALVAAMLAASDPPTALTARELPAFLRAWLAPASELRSRGEASPEALLEWGRSEGSRETAPHAWAIAGRSERALAERVIALMSARGAVNRR